MIALFCFTAVSGAGRGARAASPSPEAQFTAVFLYNFAQFVEWPSSSFSDPKAPIEIGVVSADAGVADSLVVATEGKSVGGHAIMVRRFATPDKATACHLIYIDGAQTADTKRLLKRLEKSPVLTVGNAASFLDNGGVIRLFTEGNRMRFEVNVKAMELAGLKISSQLLKMASNH